MKRLLLLPLLLDFSVPAITNILRRIALFVKTKCMSCDGILTELKKIKF